MTGIRSLTHRYTSAHTDTPISIVIDTALMRATLVGSVASTVIVTVTVTVIVIVTATATVLQYYYGCIQFSVQCSVVLSNRFFDQ